MFRGMFSGISGMKANQTKLDVIGNNISNVGTTAFKSSRARFQDMLSQSYSDAMAPAQNIGGINPSQVGLGVQLAAIDTVMKQGMMQPTGRNLDFALDGDGFFMVAKGPKVFGDGTIQVNHRPGTHNVIPQSLQTSGMELNYSRDGSFTLDEEGNLLTGDGYRILGYSLSNDVTSVPATAKSPNVVSTGGFNFRFGAGAALNGYRVVVGAVGPQTPASADVDKATRTITVNGDFSTEGALTSDQLESAVNRALNSAGIGQTMYVTGKASVINGMFSERVKGGSDAQRPGSVNFAGFNIKFGEGDALNQYVIELGKFDDTTFSADISADKKIKINGNFKGGAALSSNELRDIINKALQDKGITQKVTEVTGTQLTFPKLSDKVVPNADPTKAPGNLTVAGFSFEFPSNKYNDVEIVFESINEEPLDVTVDLDTAKKITIKGDFVKGGITPETLKAAINAKITDVGNQISKISGKFSLSSGLVSNTIEGGTALAKPGIVNAAGLEFDFENGASLNDYIIQIGKISAGTQTSSEIDATNKRIIINMDLVSPNGTTNTAIQNAINKALENKGINQRLTVKGVPTQVYDTESLITDGGTPVQSIDNNGELNYVDGTKDLKSYDGNLKCLRIPEKVRIPGTDDYLRVKTFTISKEGVVNAVLEDGRVAALGQIATVSFKNSVGLTKLGKNIYQQSVNSGDPILRSGVGTLGEDNSKGYGDILQGMLEMSNVDLAEQFTEMIITNRAFQASGKMITTGDEILQDIINLKR
ncbi:flagellar hook protein FlgE [Clostridium amylolyticum]|uniref:Flagellar hook protein FlgE n=2 Tax=Clostridium amylolyticum TaxID=1121298 RepID=A0A1M6CFH0_9CLOT|nr:flagellar hook-basal body complex protein [Clostridium amylolyticum]SHI59775.1 flagellar hook protein FlgE [Clostridium amylolyticum]